jgi:TonB-linked SusC/RagA family outer membrane protein
MNLNLKLKTGILACLLLVNSAVTAQKTAVTGTVKDSSGEVLSGVSIHIVGTAQGTVTGTDGTYTINVPGEKDVLEFSYLGYVTQQITAGNRTIIDVTLQEDVANLDEIVVVGYGSVKKSNLTGAISSVKMADIPMVTTTSVSNLLTGRVPGLVITQNSADPTGDYTVLIRGAASTGAGNSPLYVIDGFPGGNINTISPNDIESVEVLKDASATAIYGARAANGVILVNTKKGKAGKLTVSVQLNTSLQTISNPYDIVSAKDYMRLSNAFFKEKWMSDNKIAPYGDKDPSTVTSTPKIAFTDEQIASAKDNTNWFDEISRTGTIDNENISITGGSEQATYTFSLGHFKHKGVIINNGYEKFMGRLGAEFKLAKWIATGVSISGSQQNSDKIEQPGGTEDATGLIKLALSYPTYLPMRDDNGDYLINPNHATYPNPVSYKDVTNTETANRYLINNFWNIYFTKDLVFRASWGLNQAFYRNNTYYPKTTYRGKLMNSDASISEYRNSDYLLDATLTYKKLLFKNHQLTAMAGYAYQKFISENVWASNSDFITDVYNVYNLGGGGDLTKQLGSEKSMYKFLSYFGRVNYDIADRYLFTFTVRADGSDRFGSNSRFGYFPSGAVAWRVTEEDFMKEQDFLSNLKLRFSLGQTGNSEIGGNAFGYYTTSGNLYVIGGSLLTGVTESQIPNPKLKWETTTEFNAGLDFGLFKNRLSGTFEYYRKTIRDLLDSRNLGAFYPVSSVADNLGTTLGQGWELNLTGVNVQNANFIWTTNLNLAHFEDRWKERNPFTNLAVYQTTTDPLHVEWGYVSDGLIQPDDDISHMQGSVVGNIKVKDLNGWLKDDGGNYILDANGRQQLSGKPDGAVDDADKVIIYHSQPKLTFGLLNTLQYKNFDLSFFFYGELGREKYNDTRAWFLKADRLNMGDNVLTDALDVWSHDNPNGKYPNGFDVKYASNSDFWVERAEFVRLKSLTFGYTFPKTWGKAFSNARIYVDLQNLFVLTNYSGSDPETDSYSAYPYQRTYSLGINLNF